MIRPRLRIVAAADVGLAGGPWIGPRHRRASHLGQIDSLPFDAADWEIGFHAPESGPGMRLIQHPWQSLRTVDEAHPAPVAILQTVDEAHPALRTIAPDRG